MGFVGNINYAQMIDLAAGFAGLDPCGDDGYRYGLWPWQTEQASSSYAGELRKQMFELPSEPPGGPKPPPAKGGVYWGRSKNPMPRVAGAKPAATEKK